MWAGSVKQEFTARIQFTRNVGKNARMRSQCVPGSLKRAWVRPITSINYRSSPLTTVTVASYPRPSSLFYNGKDKLYNGEASPLGLGMRLL